jgi:hypothetical protein
MFEFGIFCVIFLAVAYWAVLWLMGRREDVLHGEFVEGDLQADEPARSTLPEQPAFQPERLASLLNAIKRDLDKLVPK